MKKTLVTLAALVLVLGIAPAYALETNFEGNIMDPVRLNGITAIEPAVAPTMVGGSGPILANGVTVYNAGVPKTESDYAVSGSAAGGMSDKDSHTELWNGITRFDGAPEGF